MLTGPLSAFGEARFATEDVISAAPSGREGIACPSATATCSGIEFDWGLSKGVCVRWWWHRRAKFLTLGSDTFKTRGGAINVSANNIALNGAPGFDVCLSV